MGIDLKITSSLPGRRRVGWVFTNTFAFSVDRFSKAELQAILRDPYLMVCVGETITESAFDDFMATRAERARTTQDQLLIASAAPGRRRAGCVFTGVSANPLNHFSRAQLWAILGDRFLTLTIGYVLTLDNLDAFLRERGTDNAEPIDDPVAEAELHAAYEEIAAIRQRAPGPEIDDGERFDDVEPPPVRPGRPRKSPLKDI